MSKHWTLYWNSQAGERTLAYTALNPTSGGEKVQQGSTIWIFNQKDKRLILLGRIVVEELTDKAQDVRDAIKHELWKGDMDRELFAIAKQPEPRVDLDVSDLALKLTSTRHETPLAMFDDEGPFAFHIRSIRPLTLESVQLLENAYYNYKREDELFQEDIRLYSEGERREQAIVDIRRSRQLVRDKKKNSTGQCEICQSTLR